MQVDKSNERMQRMFTGLQAEIKKQMQEETSKLLQ